MFQPATGKITRNTFYLTASYVAQKILALVYFTLLARHFGASGLGQYVFALSFVTMFSIATDLGINTVITKETAKDPRWPQAHLGLVLLLKIILALIAYGGLVLTINALGYPDLTRHMVYLAGIFMLMDSFTASFYAIFRGWQKIKYEGIGTVMQQSLLLIIGGAFLLLNFPLLYFIGIFLIASLANFTFAAILLYRHGGLKLNFHPEKKLIVNLAVLAAPFALAGIFTRIYAAADSVILSKISGDSAVGIYSSAYKLTFALQFIPIAFGASIFPAFSNYYHHSRDHLARTFDKAWRYLLVIALPIAAGSFVLAPEIIQLIYGSQFAAAALPLRVLMASLVLIFLFHPTSSLLNACNRQSANTLNLGLAMAVNVLLNFLLIPKFSYLGASWAVFFSYALLVGLNLFHVRAILGRQVLSLFKSFAAILVASLLMGLGVFYLKGYLFFLWLIIPAAIFYLLLLFWWRVLKKDDLISLLKIKSLSLTA